MPIRFTQPIGRSVGICITSFHDDEWRNIISALTQRERRNLSTAGTYLEVPASHYARSSQ